MLTARTAEQVPQLYHITFETVSSRELLPFDNIETLFNEVTTRLEECSIFLPGSWQGEWPGDMERPIKNEGAQFQFLQDPVGGEPSRIALRVTRQKNTPLPHIQVTDYLIAPGESDDRNRWRLSVALRAGGANLPLLLQEAAPEPLGIVTKFLREHICYDESVRLRVGHMQLSAAGFWDLADTVNVSARELPAVVLANGHGQDSLSAQIVGLAHVFSVDSPDTLVIFHKELLSAQFPRNASWLLHDASGGTAGMLYWPAATQNGAAHRTQLPLSQLFHVLAAFSLQCRKQHEQSWESFAREKIQRRIKKVSKSEDKGKIEELQQQLTRAKKDCERADAEKDEFARKLHSARQLKARFLRTDSLCEGLGRKGLSRSLEDVTIESVEEAIAAARQDFEDRIDFEHMKMKSRLFERAGELYLAFKWLANDYLLAKTKDVKYSMGKLEESCRRACGFDYAAGQSEHTMEMFPEDYTFIYQGQRVKAAEHLRWGVAHHPELTLRMTFYCDAESSKVVIYYFGMHPRTQIT